MAEKLINPGHSVSIVRGADFTNNKPEEIKAKDNRLYTASVIVDGVGNRIASIDGSTYTLNVITYPHHEIHEGNHYYVEGYATLGLGEELRIKLVTPNTTKWGHLVWEIGSTFILTFELWEGASGGMTGGTGVIPLNSNRNSANTSGMVLTRGVTEATDDGALISDVKFGSRTFGGTQKREDEIILKQDTIYLRKFISGSASNIVTFKANWYEHTNKE